MCGIVGYVGGRGRASDVIVDGLRRLEYRGYDSAGVAVLRPAASSSVRRAAGKLAQPRSAPRASSRSPGRVGIGHTRWATHGRPSEENAHPHRTARARSSSSTTASSRTTCALQGAAASRRRHASRRETDTEVIAHLVERSPTQAHARGPPSRRALRASSRALRDRACCHRRRARTARGARSTGPPLVVGLGEGEHFLASRHPGDPAATRATSVPRGRRDRGRHPPTASRSPTRDGTPVDARAAARSPGTRSRPRRAATTTSC